jgi:hypothetical protein
MANIHVGRVAYPTTQNYDILHCHKPVFSPRHKGGKW